MATVFQILQSRPRNISTPALLELLFRDGFCIGHSQHDWRAVDLLTADIQRRLLTDHHERPMRHLYGNASRVIRFFQRKYIIDSLLHHGGGNTAQRDQQWIAHD
ncbi:hypothetical protein D3C76_1564540 [compost metagenome]